MRIMEVEIKYYENRNKVFAITDVRSFVIALEKYASNGSGPQP